MPHILDETTISPTMAAALPSTSFIPSQDSELNRVAYLLLNSNHGTIDLDPYTSILLDGRQLGQLALKIQQLVSQPSAAAAASAPLVLNPSASSAPTDGAESQTEKSAAPAGTATEAASATGSVERGSTVAASGTAIAIPRARPPASAALKTDPSPALGATAIPTDALAAASTALPGAAALPPQFASALQSQLAALTAAAPLLNLAPPSDANQDAVNLLTAEVLKLREALTEKTYENQLLEQHLRMRLRRIQELEENVNKSGEVEKLKEELKAAKVSRANQRRAQEHALKAYMKASVYSLKQLKKEHQSKDQRPVSSESAVA